MDDDGGDAAWCCLSGALSGAGGASDDDELLLLLGDTLLCGALGEEPARAGASYGDEGTGTYTAGATGSAGALGGSAAEDGGEDGGAQQWRCLDATHAAPCARCVALHPPLRCSTVPGPVPPPSPPLTCVERARCRCTPAPAEHLAASYSLVSDAAVKNGAWRRGSTDTRRQAWARLHMRCA
jgi:hypothetical protein